MENLLLILFVHFVKFCSFLSAISVSLDFRINTEYNGRYCSGEAHAVGNMKSRTVCGIWCQGLAACGGFFYNTISRNCSVVEVVSLPEKGCQPQNGSVYYMLLGCYSGSAQSYGGTWGHTVSGKRCQLWNTQSPHNHTAHLGVFPKGESAVHARFFCRDPTLKGYPWCYTTDPQLEWETCGIPECP